MIRIRCLALLLISAQFTTAKADVSTFEQANRLYGQGHFRDAARTYSRLIESGVVSPSIYFNLGNASFRAGDLGSAIVAYRQAERLAPRDADLRANLEFVRRQVQGPSARPNIIERTTARLTLNEWTGITLVPFWICLLAAAAAQLRPARKSLFRTLAWTCGIISVVTLGGLIAAWTGANQAIGVVTVDQTTVHTGPLDESPIAFSVRDGAELRIVDEKDSWLNVAAGRRVGWLKRENVLVLQSPRPSS